MFYLTFYTIRLQKYKENNAFSADRILTEAKWTVFIGFYTSMWSLKTFLCCFSP
jgi:hypothetical protein